VERKNITEANGDKTPQLVWDASGTAHYVVNIFVGTDHGSALSSLVLVNARTGEAREYKAWGLDEDGARAVIDAAIPNSRGWHAAQPTPFTIAGRLVFTAPLVSSEHIFQEFGIVDTETQMVALGGSKEVAVRNFLQLLAARKLIPSSAEKEIVGTVSRVGDVRRNGESAKVLTFTEAPGKYFVAETTALASTVQIGDRLKVRYVSVGNSPESEVSSFVNLNFTEPKK
jgi:hypothetical protein